MLLLGVDDPDGLRGAGHVADAAQVLGQLVLLAGQAEELLLGEAGALHLVEVHRLQLLHPGDPLGDGLDVGEHATQPALVHVRHADPGGLLGDGLLGLLLGADEQHLTAAGDGPLDEGVRLVDVLERLLQIDDVDAVALVEDEALHLRVPTTGLVPEVDTVLEQLAGSHDGHGRFLLVGAQKRPTVLRYRLSAPPDAVTSSPTRDRTGRPVRPRRGVDPTGGTACEVTPNGSRCSGQSRAAPGTMPVGPVRPAARGAPRRWPSTASALPSVGPPLRRFSATSVHRLPDPGSLVHRFGGRRRRPARASQSS
ncbi:hypothetical protein SDC9_130098 [bioreactor metagenome]|uniref:Uncharacterized protein n=1 Tax=bioreactor metagenome TaxID=1076179 RepID=A0A645D1K4_9ZZZZ